MDTPTPAAPPRRPPTAPAATGLDLAALAADNLTPVLGRYFERSWSHGEGHRLYDTDGKAYLDFANGIAVSVLGHRNPRVTAAIHAQVDRLIGPDGGHGLRRADRAPGPRAGGDAPRPDRLDLLPELRQRGDRGRAQARPPGHRPARDRRLPGRLPRPDASAPPASPARTPTTARATSRSCRASTSASSRPSTATSAGDEERAVAVAFRHLRDLLPLDDLAGRGRRDRHRAGPGRGRLRPGAAGLPRRSCAASATGTASCSSPTRSRRASGGPGGCGRSSTPGSSPTSSAWPRRSRTACRSRRSPARRRSRSAGARAPTARPTAATPSSCAAGLAVLEEIRERGLVANAAARGAELTAGLREIAAARRADRRRPRARA